MSRICYLTMVRQEVGGSYLALTQKVFPKIIRPDTQLDVKFVEPGLERMNDSRISYFGVINAKEIIEGVIKAESQGYDAVVIGAWIDRGLREARSMVNIPVIGGGEASMLTACMLGHKFAVVTLNAPNTIPEGEILINSYGLKDRAIMNPVRTVSASIFEVMTTGMVNPEIIAADVIDKAKKCVEDGAEVVIAGCSGLGPQCSAAGVNRIPGTEIPILDSIAVAIKIAEMAVELKKQVGFPFPSRAGLYFQPKEKHLERIRKIIGIEK